MSDGTSNGGHLRILSVLDEYSRECLALRFGRQLTAADLIAVMERLVAQRGVPGLTAPSAGVDRGPNF